MKPCSRCFGEGRDNVEGYERYSMGVYAGRYCDHCWHKHVGPGYRDYQDPTVKFDPADAGEALEPEDY
jgi:hypothetical protein